MNESKSDRSLVRGEPVRLRVIEAAERLLRQGKAEFSMRELAAEAGVSFATPFNQFGSKAAIMHAISARRVELMNARFRKAAPPGDALDRVLVAVNTAVSVMLEEPVVNRSVMGWIGTASPAAGTALARSEAFWALALAFGDGLAPAARKQAMLTLPRQLAFGFRGVLSFWTAGELADDDLAARAREMAVAILLGVVDGQRESIGSPAQQEPE
ncbi:TetR/AcrR family transcriptional regulator [Sphingomonas dokdonensis]|uniref:Bacterial regulatory protein, tetR family n=1 Tax=Sphingomonas dokdonensis TaxID=344880 RepID=A0A245ZTQ5_9SPHN|nr:TetR/AcrR family transcriptional regulator [Sphingomonas dokdonensis]OWK33135.1 bacterial regulatory protein, tetR family [Sphingomonas dokdonensis]